MTFSHFVARPLATVVVNIHEWYGCMTDSQSHLKADVKIMTKFMCWF
jgi:hypothetical protein